VKVFGAFGRWESLLKKEGISEKRSLEWKGSLYICFSEKGRFLRVGKKVVLPFPCGEEKDLEKKRDRKAKMCRLRTKRKGRNLVFFEQLKKNRTNWGVRLQPFQGKDITVIYRRGSRVTEPGIRSDIRSEGKRPAGKKKATLARSEKKGRKGVDRWGKRKM